MMNADNSRFIDLHLHLIPNVDDGPASIDETIDLAQVLVEDGVGRVAVTPHFNAWNPNMLSSMGELLRRVDQLRSLLSDAGIPLEVLPGAEHFLTPELVGQIRDREAPFLGHEPYILVELPFNDRPLYADEVLYQIELAGASPVLAHPERYTWVQNDPAAVLPLVDRGIALQCTAASLTGHYGSRIKRTAEQLLLQGSYSLVGSDIHHPDQPRHLPVMEEAVLTIAGEETARVLFHENPARVLEGRPLESVPQIVREAPKKRLFGLFG